MGKPIPQITIPGLKGEVQFRSGETYHPEGYHDYVSEYDIDCYAIWIGYSSVFLTRAQALALIAGMQSIIDKGE